MVDPLATVTRTARQREHAIAQYVAAILTAREHGATWQAIGHAAGVTRQSVHEMIRRHEERKTMTAAQISVGDRLTLKRDNPYGFGPLTLTVTDLKYRPGYKTPHVIVSGVGAFKPSDFQRKAS